MERLMMEKQKRALRQRCTGRKILAMAAVVCMFTGASMTACAGRIVYDAALGGVCSKQADGSLAVNKWEQDEWGDWFYFGPDGMALVLGCDQPGQVITEPDGNVYVDMRVRSATGQPGQLPVLSLQSAQKDIRYKGLRQVLDSIPLYPDTTTHMPELDAMLDNIFAQIITPDMDTHDKLKACYDYLILNTKDGRYEDVSDLDDLSYEIIPGPDVPDACADGGVVFFMRQGVCDTYSAAFATMAWKLGLPMYIVKGETSTGSGGYTPHAWCQLDGPDGTVYVFDPHVDYLLTLRENGTVSNVRFGPSQAQVAGKYVRISSLMDH